MPLIEVRGLTKRFGGVAAVEDLSFAVEPGTVTGLLGPNGAGKTTTLRMLLGLVEPTVGVATIDRMPYRDLANRSHRVGAVLENASFHPGRTVRDHLRVRARGGGVGPTRVDAVTDLLGLAEAADHLTGSLSLGERQRLGLAAALLGDPEILILDEPANGLDPEGVRWLRTFLRGLGQDGRTVLVSSHNLSEVAQTVDGVVVLDRGRLVARSSLEELMAGGRETVRVRAARAEELRDALEADGGRVRLVADDRLEIGGLSVERIGTLAGELSIPLFEISTETPSLEDVFLRLTARQEATS